MSFLTRQQLKVLDKIKSDHAREIMRNLFLRRNRKEVEPKSASPVK